jgi:hypothetical protein
MFHIRFVFLKEISSNTDIKQIVNLMVKNQPLLEWLHKFLTSYF